MKIRKTKNIKKALKDKGFSKMSSKEKSHHEFYYLMVDGKKSNIKTFFSHGKEEYGDSLMSKIKKELKFKETSKAEEFFDCTLSGSDYIKMLEMNGDLKTFNS